MNKYHRYINVPFELKEPPLNRYADDEEFRVKGRCGLDQCKDRCEFANINACYDQDFFKWLKLSLKVNEDKVQDFLAEYGLFSDNILYFITKPDDKMIVHIDNNKEEYYLAEERKIEDYLDDHAKINFTWGPKESTMRWWSSDKKDISIESDVDEDGNEWKLVVGNEKKSKLLYEKSIYKPSLVNAGVLHSVYNPSKIERRITQSFNIVDKRKIKLVSFQDAVEIFDKYITEQEEIA